MDFAVSLDPTLSVTQGIKEIVETLVIALVLVIIVVFVFLQGWRSTLIPLVAVPVSLVGTFVILPLFGFSINTLSLFGLPLAIGLVVDDAIVVVEGVERHIEDGMTPKNAALKAMEELSGPVVGIALVLSGVFGPTAFIPGITGRLYQQFAVTIAISVILSAFNALTLSPALAALLLRPHEESHGVLRRFFDWFNRVFERATEDYVSWSGALRKKTAVLVVLLLVFCLAAGFFANRVPSSFLPDEDQGYAYVNLQLHNSASSERTSQAATQIENILSSTPGGKYTTSVIGFSLLSFVRTSYNAFFVVTLKPWDERTSRAEQFQAIKAHLNQQLSKLPAGIAFSFSPPAISGVGTAGGFTFNLEDRIGWTLPSPVWRAHFGFQADALSGDNGRPATLGTLNAMFPRGAYFGPKFAFIGPANLLDLQPQFVFHPVQNVTGTFEWIWFWRESTKDALYTFGNVPLRPANLSSAGYVGSQPNLEIRWAISEHFLAALNVAGFITGTFLQQSPPSKEIVFFNAGLTYRF